MSINSQFIEFGINCKKLLEHFGVGTIIENDDLLKCLCPFHEEKTPSFFFRKSNGLYYCFGCGAAGDLIDFIKYKQSCTFSEACTWLMEFCGMTENPEKFFQRIAGASESNRFITMIKNFELADGTLDKVYDESFIHNLERNRREFYLQKGFTDQMLDEFEVGYAVDHHFVERLFFPIRNEEGLLMGMSGRRIDGKDDQIKWIHSTSLVKKNILYNLQNAKKYAIVDCTKELLIVEGPVDCMRSSMYGKKNVVALLGHHLSMSQRKLLMKYAFRVVLALDGDSAGKGGIEESAKMLWGSFDVFVMHLPAQKDIGDLSKEEFEECYQSKQRVTQLPIWN
mgnify:CR=1 FL=1